MATITFSNDNLDERFAGRTFVMIRCRWSENQWIADPAGDMWGIFTSEGISPFLYPPEQFGKIGGLALGHSKTPAKSAAARTNGRKGGRPRKTTAPA